jgi:hypothetical protein
LAGKIIKAVQALDHNETGLLSDFVGSHAFEDFAQQSLLPTQLLSKWLTWTAKEITAEQAINGFVAAAIKRGRLPCLLIDGAEIATDPGETEEDKTRVQSVLELLTTLSKVIMTESTSKNFVIPLIAQRLRRLLSVCGDCVAIVRQLRSDCAAFAQCLCGVCAAIVRRLRSDCAAIAQRLSGVCAAIAQRLCGDCTAYVRDCAAFVR